MHMVMFTSAEGKSATHTSDTLEEAVRFVEHIRNNEGVDDAKLYRMTEVPIEVKTYYKVEVGSSSQGETSLSTLTTNSEVPAAI